MNILLRILQKMFRFRVVFLILFSSICPSKGGDESLIASLDLIENKGNAGLNKINTAAPVNEVYPEKQVLLASATTSFFVLLHDYIAESISFWCLDSISYCLPPLLDGFCSAETHLKKE